VAVGVSGVFGFTFFGAASNAFRHRVSGA